MAVVLHLAVVLAVVLPERPAQDLDKSLTAA